MADIPFVNFAFQATGTPARRTMPDRLAEIKNVLDFGADPTGNTDSYAAIQAAINWTSGANRGTIFFPAGTYGVSQPLTFNYNGALNIRFLGVGAASTMITYWHGGAFTGSWIFDRSNVNGGSPNYQLGPIIFESLSVSAQGGASTVGCVRIGSTIGAAFRDCTFSGNVCVTTEDSAGSSSQNVLFDNCRFNNNGTNTPAKALIFGNGAALYNCDFVGCDSAIVAYGSGFSINACRLEVCNTAIALGQDSSGTARTTSAFYILIETEAVLTSIDFLAPCSGFYIQGGGIGHAGSAGYLGNSTSVYGVNMRAGNAQAGIFEACSFGGPLTTAAFAIGNASSRANVVFSGCQGNQTGSTGVGWIVPTNAFTALFDNNNIVPIWTFSQLPSGGDVFEGDEFNISDGTDGLSWGQTATNTGTHTTHYLVRYNGTNWTVVGK